MKKSALSILAASAAFTLAAAPVVRENSVTMSQSGGVVTIGYTLEGEAGIVTVDIQTNGVSIGSENLSFMAGDVNKVVQPGARTITWKPYKAWPDNSADKRPRRRERMGDGCAAGLHGRFPLGGEFRPVFRDCGGGPVRRHGRPLQDGIPTAPQSPRGKRRVAHGLPQHRTLARVQ